MFVGQGKLKVVNKVYKIGKPFVYSLMHLVEASGNRKHPVIIEPLIDPDFKLITKKRYFFNWNLEKGQTIYKLRLKDQKDVLGLMSIEDFENESRIHVRLLAVSKENKGKKKLFERIAGSLFAYTAKLAITKYGALAAISLIPKTNLGQHYMDEYGFEQAGINLFMEGKALRNLLNTYNND